MLGKNLTRVRSLVIDASLQAEETLTNPAAPTMATIRYMQNRLNEAIEILESMSNNPRLVNI